MKAVINTFIKISYITLFNMRPFYEPCVNMKYFMYWAVSFSSFEMTWIYIIKIHCLKTNHFNYWSWWSISQIFYLNKWRIISMIWTPLRFATEFIGLGRRFCWFYTVIASIYALLAGVKYYFFLLYLLIILQKFLLNYLL